LCLSTRKPEPCQRDKEQFAAKNPIDSLGYNSIRLGLTRAKALQTVSRFPRKTRRRHAAPESNAFAMFISLKQIELLKSFSYD